MGKQHGCLSLCLHLPGQKQRPEHRTKGLEDKVLVFYPGCSKVHRLDTCHRAGVGWAATAAIKATNGLTASRVPQEFHQSPQPHFCLNERPHPLPGDRWCCLSPPSLPPLPCRPRVSVGSAPMLCRLQVELVGVFLLSQPQYLQVFK